MGDQAVVGGRYGYWFPLVLLGFGLLGLLGWDSVQVREDFGWFAYGPMPTQHLGTEEHTAVTVAVDQRQFPPRDSSWAVLITATVVASAAWYGWRARGSVRASVMWAVGGGLLVLAGCLGVAIGDAIPGSGTSVGLPLVALGVLAGAWAYIRRRATVVSLVCSVIGVGVVLGGWAPGLFETAIAVGGLLVLARVERSRLLLAVAGVVLVAMVVFPFDALSMLVPAVVLLLGGVLALVRRSALV